MASRCGGQLQIYYTSSRGQSTRDVPPAWGLDEGITTPHLKKWLVTLVIQDMHGRDQKRTQELGRKTCREETTRKTKA
jgi:hypothetical protein